MIDSLYYSSRKIPEKCENSFVNYRIRILPKALSFITKDLNSAIVGSSQIEVLNDIVISTRQQLLL